MRDRLAGLVTQDGGVVVERDENEAGEPTLWIDYPGQASYFVAVHDPLSDVVDRVEVAVVVEHLVELHEPTVAEGGTLLCKTCRADLGRPLDPAGEPPYPCATRKLLGELPGGAR